MNLLVDDHGGFADSEATARSSATVDYARRRDVNLVFVTTVFAALLLTTRSFAGYRVTSFRHEVAVADRALS